MISRNGFQDALTISGSGCYRRWLFNTGRIVVPKELAARAHGHLLEETGAQTRRGRLPIHRVTDQLRFVQSDDNY